eukprot:gene10378-2510_t
MSWFLSLYRIQTLMVSGMAVIAETDMASGVYDRRPADYVFMLIFQWITLLTLAYFLNLFIIGIPLVLAIMHVWCNVNPDLIVTFCGMMELLGIITGHFFFFVKYKWPELGGPSLINTPAFIREIFPDEGGVVSGFGEAPASRQAQPERYGFTGRGRTLQD